MYVMSAPTTTTISGRCLRGPSLNSTSSILLSGRVSSELLHYNNNSISFHKINSNNLTVDNWKMDAAAAELRSRFIQLLKTRRSPADVLLQTQPTKPVKDPLYQGAPPPKHSEAMESCPKVDIPNFKELLEEENFYITTEEGEQGRLPVLILSLKESSNIKRPAVVFLHSTNKCKEWVRPLLEAYASRGYIAVAIDSRYHGERAKTVTTYEDALVSSWKRGDTMPFIFDTIWDLVKLADYLTGRDDIDHSRIGITGESLGGMHAWFAAFLDTRYSVVVPIIGVQGFRWAIDNDQWQARVDSIKSVFEQYAPHLFTIRIHHGGSFRRFPGRQYVGGQEDIFDRVDIEVFPVSELDKMVRQLSYTGETEPMFYHYLKPMSSLDVGLYALGCDEDVRCMTTLLLSFKLIEVYIEHGCTKLNCYQMSPRQIRATIEEYEENVSTEPSTSASKEKKLW